MSWETERALTLLAKKQLAPKEYSDADALELVALVETISARWESRGRYTDDVRGIHALERVNARLEKRDPDYAAASARANKET